MDRRRAHAAGLPAGDGALDSVTGDNERTANAVARKLGIDQVEAGLEPQRKHERIRELRQEGAMVAMAGEAIERETDLTVRGQADDGQQALAGVVSLKPDIVLTDLQLKSSNGLHLIKDLRTNAPAIPIVATTMFDGWRNERLARAAGAVGFVSKQDGPEKLIATVQEVLKGGKNTTDQTSGKQTRLHDEQQSTNSKNKKGIT